LASEIEFVVRFAGAEAVPAPEVLGQPDPVILRSLLNPREAVQWRTVSPRHAELMAGWRGEARAGGDRAAAVGTGPTSALAIRPLDPGALLGPEVRLRVGSTGLVRVTLGDLLAKGFPAGVARSALRLYQKRPNDVGDLLYDNEAPLPLTADVPVHFLGTPDPNGTVTAGDQIVFYAHAPAEDDAPRLIEGQTFPEAVDERADNFNGQNVYFVAAVQPDAEGWARMESIALPAAGQPLQPSYQRIDQLESDTVYQDNPDDGEQQRYHWTPFTAAESAIGVEFFNPVPAQPIDLTWTMVARVVDGQQRPIRASLEKGTAKDTLAVVNVGLVAFRRLTATSATSNTDVVGNGFATFALRRADGFPLLQAYLGNLRVSYPARFMAVREELRFSTGQQGGTPNVEVTGFPTADLEVFEVTDPRAPRVVAVQPENLRADGGTFTLSLQAAQLAGQERSFWALRPTRLDAVRDDDIEAAPVPDVTTHAGFFPEGQAQVLAIGPPQMEAPLQPWLQWRRAHDRRGWRYAFVEVQAIYDQFSGGLKSPAGIKRFIEYAYLNWDARAVMLLGEAGEDARELTGTGGPDLVPRQLHRQIFTTNEVLGSDKWYVTFEVDDNYPDSLDRGPDMMIGRLSAGTPAELTALVAKVLAYEQPTTGDDWRRTVLWIADDAFSNSVVLGGGESNYCLNPVEPGFEQSQRYLESLTDSLHVDLAPEGFYLRSYTDTFHAPSGCADLQQTQQFVGNTVVSQLMSRLNQGALVVSIQSHANWNVLCHESLMTDTEARALTNAGRPFLFFGIGCHVSDFLRVGEGQGGQQRSLGQIMLHLPTGGAIATYGSNGFEYLRQNSKLMEKIGEAMFTRGRTTSPILDDPWSLDSQWTLAEILGQGEHDVFPTASQLERQMVAQYNLLGDPLLRLDAAPPRLTVLRDGVPLAGDEQISLPAGSTSLDLTLQGVDETGMDRFVVSDTKGFEYGAQPACSDPADPRRCEQTVALPIHAYGGLLDPQDADGPRGYRLRIEAYDRAYFDARPAVFELLVPFTLAVWANGAPLQEGAGALLPDAETQLEVEFTSALALTTGQIAVAVEGGLIGPVTATLLDGDGHQWRLSFAARGDGTGAPQSLQLTLAGTTTEFRLTETAAVGELAIGQHYPFPSPADPSRSPLYFVAQVQAPVEWARVTVYDLSGRRVAHVEGPGSGAQLEVVVSWDGRDDRGDELANGVYMYRVEAGAGGASVRSDMGRVVLMR
jgi:hypothetical protein